MKADIKVKSDILKTFIQEDRNEIRITRDRIHNITSSIVIASFAITAFLYGKLDTSVMVKAKLYSVLVDLLLICLMIISFRVLKRNLTYARKALKARQNLLNGLQEDDNSDLNIFPADKEIEPDISDNDLSWLVGLAVAILVGKIIIGFLIFD